MSRRLPALVAIALLAAGVVATVLLPLSPRRPSTDEEPSVISGTWFCPHGGGEGWRVTLSVANPGTAPVAVRVTSFDEEGRGEVVERTVPGSATIAVRVDANSLASASLVEYFGGWVAAGWVTEAGGDRTGVAAEPCAADTASRWYLPDMSTVEDEDDAIIVENPFSADAVFSVTLLSPGREPTRTDALTNVLLPASHSTAVRLRKTLLGEATVAAVVDVSVGRLAVATLDVTGTSGIRSAIGYAGSLTEPVVLPGALGSGSSDLIAMIPGSDAVSLSATLLGEGPEQPVAGLAEAAPTGGSARAFPVTAADASAIVSSNPGVAVARRAEGGREAGSLTGGLPAAAWVVLPTVPGPPAHIGIVIANPGEESATVVVRALGPGASPITLRVGPRQALLVPPAFADRTAAVGVLVVATSGTIVVGAGSTSGGTNGFANYATALGVPVPDAWVPAP